MRSVAVPILVLLAATAAVVDWGRRSAARTAPRYVCRDLGTLRGGRASVAAINERGQVVGVSNLNDKNAQRAFLHDGKRMIDLGAQRGWGNSWAHDIDDAGRVVGNASVPSSSGQSSRAFLFEAERSRYRFLGWPAQPGESVAAGRLHPDASTARAIGSAGEVVGSIRYLSRRHLFRASLWGDAGPTDLGTLGGDGSEAHAINRWGWVVGEAQTREGDQRAFLWVGGTMRDLGTLGGPYSTANGMNDRGEVVGEAARWDTGNRAFLWRRGGMRDLGALGGEMGSVAYGINNVGQIVGASDVPVPSAWRDLAGSALRARAPGSFPKVREHAVLWHRGTIHDLNELCNAPGVVLVSARAINERGQIAANGLTRVGELHAMLLTPTGAGGP